MRGIKQVALEHVTEDMILAKDIIDGHDRVLVTAGASLRRETLALLVKHKIQSVWIRISPEKNREITTIPNLISTATRLRMINVMQNAFKAQGSIVHHLPYLRQCIEEVIKELSQHEHLLIYLTDIRHHGDYLYGHCVDVGLFAVVIGQAMGLSKDEITVLGIGGLLHDYGKISIPQEILNKCGPLNPEEFEQVKRHVSAGYNNLRAETRVDSRIALMALQHHERPDGRGYPWGIKHHEIHPLARIVAVADVYDALITDRVYRPRIAPHEAIKTINAGSGTQFDSQVIAAFNKVGVPYYIGSAVKLDNGRAGAVVRINSSAPSRPVIWTRQGCINLMHEKDINIVAVI